MIALPKAPRRWEDKRDRRRENPGFPLSGAPPLSRSLYPLTSILSLTYFLSTIILSLQAIGSLSCNTERLLHISPSPSSFLAIEYAGPM